MKNEETKKLEAICVHAKPLPQTKRVMLCTEKKEHCDYRIFIFGDDYCKRYMK